MLVWHAPRLPPPTPSPSPSPSEVTETRVRESGARETIHVLVHGQMPGLELGPKIMRGI